MILSLEDVATLFENRFTVQMLQQLERHILTMNQFRLNVATPLDFCLHFTYGEREFLESKEMRPEQLVNMALPLLHFAISQYNISRKRYSSIGIAAICHIMQETCDMTTNQDQAQQEQDTKQCRDMWLSTLITKYKEEIDLQEVYEILKDFKSPEGNHKQTNEQTFHVQQPWDFRQVRMLGDLRSSTIS